MKILRKPLLHVFRLLINQAHHTSTDGIKEDRSIQCTTVSIDMLTMVMGTTLH